MAYHNTSFLSGRNQLEVFHPSIVFTWWDTNPSLSLCKLNRSSSTILIDGEEANSGNLFFSWEEYQSYQLTTIKRMDHLYSSDLLTPKFNNCLYLLPAILIQCLTLNINELKASTTISTLLDGGNFAVFCNWVVFHILQSLLSRVFILLLFLSSLKSILAKDYSWQSRFFVQISQLFEKTLVHMLELELCLEIATLRHLDDYSYHHRFKNLLTKSRYIT